MGRQPENTSSSRFFRVAALLGSLLTASACGGGPNGPSTTAPQIACPPALNLSGVLGGGQSVIYAPPTISGGAPPVVSTCSPASGSSFPLGITTVSCQATDAQARQSSCSFTVTLNAVSLNIVRFMAFGDSVTEGQDGRALFFMPIVDSVHAYPTVLQGRLAADFPQQSPTVLNKGLGGEFAASGVTRLVTELAAQQPEGLLLLEGYNDLLNFGLDGVDGVLTALQTDIRNAKARGVRAVYVSTLTPSRRATGPSNRAIDSRAIQQLNARLIVMAAAENAVLVNAYDAFIGREAELVGDDGLHLTAAGNVVLAELFYTRIRATAASGLR